jgi:hypothetical protein
MHALLRGLSAASLIALLGCYHATVETGATPSTVVIDKSFASSWIYGLVPPDVVSTASKCTDGVAKIETQHTFVNELVGFLTLGIYTPMQIKVTCATRNSASAHVGSSQLAIKGMTPAARQEAFAKAVFQADKTRKAVYLEF